MDVDGSLSFAAAPGGSPSFAAAPGSSLSFATGSFVVAAWLHAGGLECLAGDPTSKWKSLSLAAFFFFLEGGFCWESRDSIVQSFKHAILWNLVHLCYIACTITLRLLEICLFSLGALLELVFRDLLFLEPVVPELLSWLLLSQAVLNTFESKLLSSCFISARFPICTNVTLDIYFVHVAILASNFGLAAFQ